MTVLLALKVGVATLSLLAVLLLYYIAWVEPNDRGFWDADNPSGFHRFVPATYAALVLALINGFLWFGALGSAV